jgi:predicted transposase/invertase (TIGR01784 family)
MNNKDKYADPTLDWSFKRMFLSPGHEVVLKTFLNDVLEGELIVEEVTSIKGLEQTEVDSKKIIYDIHCRSSKKENFIIEIQRQQASLFFKRLEYYRSRGISGQIKTAERYPEIMPVVVIAVCDFPIIEALFPSAKTIYFEKVYYQGLHTGKPIPGPPLFVFLDLPRYRAMGFPKNNLLEEWFQIFTCQDVPSEIVINRENVRMALDDLAIDSLSLEERGRMEIEALQKAKDLDVLTTAEQRGIEKGKAEGEKKKALEIYESLIASGTPKDQALKIVKLKPSDLTP